MYPELYKELTKGRSLSYRTFFTWLTISVYQGGTIMLLSLLLFESEFLHIVAISFTALVLNELIMVALEITTWHKYMVMSEVATAIIYFGSMWILPEYFGESLAVARADLFRHALCPYKDVCVQGCNHRRGVESSTLRDQGAAPPTQPGSLRQGERVVEA
jgi:phospholipid-translocating ATPase